ncbi:UNVERIFIED_CONTAM: hypothetical protein FKN15_037357 [Acipenser sinensis]
MLWLSTRTCTWQRLRKAEAIRSHAVAFYSDLYMAEAKVIRRHAVAFYSDLYMAEAEMIRGHAVAFYSDLYMAEATEESHEARKFLKGLAQVQMFLLVVGHPCVQVMPD